jgi:tetratricopeptide (TPR) repeat protein
MPVNTELTRPETDDDFEAMCCVLYQQVYRDPGLMRVGGTGQGQFGVDLLGVDRRSPSGISVGVQCKNYVNTKFTLTTVTDDVDKADRANLHIDHLTFATTAPASAAIVRKIHELSEQRRRTGKFSVSVEYWNTIQAHVRMFPEVGKAFIPGYPGGTLLEIRENILKVVSATDAQTAIAQQRFDSLEAKQDSIQELLATVIAPGARALTPEPKGDEADPGVVVSLNYVRDRLREGKTRDARMLLDELGDPEKFRDAFSKFRWRTNSAAIELIEGRYAEGAAGFLKAFELAPDNEKAHINRAHAYFLLKKYEAAEVACEEALAKFPQSAPLWAMRMHIRAQLGLGPEDEAVPPEAREKPDYLFSLARVRANAGDRPAAIALLKRCVELDRGSLEGRRAYLAEALMWVDTNKVSVFLGQIADERRSALEEAVRLFEPLEETLSAIQSVHLSEELATNITSSLALLGDSTRARSIATQLLARHPDLDQLLRTRLVDLAEKKDAAGLKALTGGRLESLPPAAIALLAEASANLGDLSWHAEIQDVAAKRVCEDPRLQEIAPLVAVAAWRSGNQQRGLALIQEYVARHPNHVVGRVIAARLFESLGRVQEAKREAQACIDFLPDKAANADTLQVADLLASLDMNVPAASLYECFVEVPRADELTAKLLQCLVSSDQRKKAQLLLERLAPTDRSQKSIRHIEINLAARMMDWRRMTSLLEPDLTDGRLRADVALGYGTALYRMNEMERLKVFAESNPVLVKGDVDQELEFSKLQVAAGLPRLGLKRLFGLFRKHPHNVRVAGIFLGQILMASDVEALAAPERVAAGTAAELRVGDERWWVAIDNHEAESVETWSEVVAPTTGLAEALSGAAVGDSRKTTRGGVSIDAEVFQITSLFAFALKKAHQLIENHAGAPGPVWSVRIRSEDGKLDINALLQQARKRREHVDASFQLYRDRRIPLGLLARLLGSDPITLLLDWPLKRLSLFIGLGNDDERQAAFSAIREPGQRFVMDLLTISEMLLRGTGDAVVATIGRPLIPVAQRQQLLDMLRDLAGDRFGSTPLALSQRPGIPIAPNLEPRARFMQSVLAFIDDYCDVVATAGPEVQSDTLRGLIRVLDAPSGECVLLCLERDAVLLSEDGGLRLLAAEVGVTKLSALQPVWMVAIDKHHLDQKKYASCLAEKLLANHDFVSVSGRDLIELATGDPRRVHPAIRMAFETFKRPTLEIRSGMNVCGEFLSLAVKRLPPTTAGAYVGLAREALLYERSHLRARVLDRLLASRISIYGRNGRSLRPHVKRLFCGLLSRRHLRR